MVYSVYNFCAAIDTCTTCTTQAIPNYIFEKTVFLLDHPSRGVVLCPKKIKSGRQRDRIDNRVAKVKPSRYHNAIDQHDS